MSFLPSFLVSAFCFIVMGSVSASVSFDSPAVDDLATLAKLKTNEVMAALGNAEALLHLGDMFASGKGIPVDLQAAFFEYQQSAELGLVAGQLAVAKCYFFGRGVEQDYKKAFQWFEKAAAQGCADAKYNLGEMYRQGLGGVKKDLVRAVFWLEQAADQGVDLAKKTLEELKSAVEPLKP